MRCAGHGSKAKDPEDTEEDTVEKHRVGNAERCDEEENEHGYKVDERNDAPGYDGASGRSFVGERLVPDWSEADADKAVSLSRGREAKDDEGEACREAVQDSAREDR